MDHRPGFLKLVNEARPYVREISIDEARQRLTANPKAVLVDVREDLEWQTAHAVEAVHLGKGVLERHRSAISRSFNRTHYVLRRRLPFGSDRSSSPKDGLPERLLARGRLQRSHPG